MCNLHLDTKLENSDIVRCVAKIKIGNLNSETFQTNFSPYSNWCINAFNLFLNLFCDDIYHNIGSITLKFINLY